MYDKELESIIIEIKSGELNGIKYLSSLPDNIFISKDECLELLVRVIFMKKIKDSMKAKQRKWFFYGICSLIIIKWFLI